MNEESIEVAEDGTVVIHNPEQLEIIAILDGLKAETEAVLVLALDEREENESLYDEGREWSNLSCARVERFIDGAGNMGWRAYIDTQGRSFPVLMGYVRDRLLNAGWDGAEVAAA